MGKKYTLLYGTGNAAKLTAMRSYLKELTDLEIIGLKDLPLAWETPEETGRDPLENARQKALCYYRACGRPVFSADSGLYIEGLSEEEQPGVHVRRVGGVNLTGEQMRAHYKQIAARFGGRCAAQYQNAVCLVFSEDEIYESRAEDLCWDKFWLTTEERPQRMAGFPLDAISVDMASGKHFYDCVWEKAPDGDGNGNGFSRFMREALQKHEERLQGEARLRERGEDSQEIKPTENRKCGREGAHLTAEPESTAGTERQDGDGK